MRYQVQILTTGSRARVTMDQALAERLLAEADVTPAFVQGIASEAQLRQLTARGLFVSVLATIADEIPARVTRSIGRASTSFRTGPSDRDEPDAYTSGHFVLTLHGMLTPKVRQQLADAGATILERLGDSRWSIRLDGFLGTVVRLSAVARLEPSKSAAPPIPRSRGPGRTAFPDRTSDRSFDEGVAGYEAILETDADPPAVAAAMAAVGATLLSMSGRIVRFLAGPIEIDAVRAIDGVASVSGAGVPRVLHDMARPLIGITTGVTDRPGGLTGEGETVGIADTGIDATHPDFAGRIVHVVARGRPGDGSDPDGHGTHVAGTIAGDGKASNGTLAGIAPRVLIFVQSLLDSTGGLGGLPADVGELFQEAYDAGVRVHNNSWGIFLNARYAGPSIEVDAFVASHPDFLPVIAAGNDGSCLPGLNSGGPGMIDMPSMAVPATAKNALVVGASRSSRTTLGYAEMTYGDTWPDEFDAPPIADAAVSGDPSALAAFSARGPTDDLRIKPDVVAPGTDIASTKSSTADDYKFWGAYPNNDKYALMGGTSMACPMVSGIAVLVRQYFRQARSHAPSAALLRATIINGAERLTGMDAVAAPLGDPNLHQGFGRVNLANTLPGDKPGFALSFVDSIDRPDLELQTAGDMIAFAMPVVDAGEVRLCLAWTDPAGRALQNMLLITVETPTGDVFVSNPDIVRQMAFPTPLPAVYPPMMFNRDPNNNVHVLRFTTVGAGRHVVTIAALDVISPQGFSLVASGAVGALARI